MSETIMVIDDEEQMRKMIRTFLEMEGYKVIEASDGAQALTLLNETEPHLLIVDVMMPFMDGFTFVKEVRLTSEVPIIFLSARGEKWDQIHGLRLGGDDYIAKPFVPEELLARVQSVLRRAYRKNRGEERLKMGPLVIDKEAHQATLNGEPLALTRKEFNLLYLLAKNKGRVYSRQQLLSLVWGDSLRSSERTVDTHIKTLRLKLGEQGKWIKTVWGIGYKFEV